jgi:hypothetical protein
MVGDEGYGLERHPRVVTVAFAHIGVRRDDGHIPGYVESAHRGVADGYDMIDVYVLTRSTPAPCLFVDVAKLLPVPRVQPQQGTTVVKQPKVLVVTGVAPLRGFYRDSHVVCQALQLWQ